MQNDANDHNDRTAKPADDTARVVRYLVIKAAIFIGIPVIASIIAVLAILK